MFLYISLFMHFSFFSIWPSRSFGVDGDDLMALETTAVDLFVSDETGSVTLTALGGMPGRCHFSFFISHLDRGNAVARLAGQGWVQLTGVYTYVHRQHLYASLLSSSTATLSLQSGPPPSDPMACPNMSNWQLDELRGGGGDVLV